MPGSCWVLYLHDPREDVLAVPLRDRLAGRCRPAVDDPNGDGASGWAARNRIAVVNARAARDFEAAGVPAGGRPFQSALSYPFIDGEELIGTLTIYHADRDPFREEHRHVLDHISAQVASVLRNAVAFERMRDVSFTDPLTELPNSRALADFFRQLVVDRARRAGAERAHHDRPRRLQGGQRWARPPEGRRSAARGGDAPSARTSAARTSARGMAATSLSPSSSGCDLAEAEQRARDLQNAVGRVSSSSRRAARVLSLGISVGVSVFPDDGTTIEP